MLIDNNRPLLSCEVLANGGSCGIRKSSPAAAVAAAVVVGVEWIASRVVKGSGGVMGTNPRTISESGLVCSRGLMLNGWLVRLCMGLQ